MSGIEIVGIAASVIQIADLGARLSVRLFVFSKKIRSADKAIEAISQDIAATGAVLRELGLELSKDENAELCTNGALSTAKNLIAACQKVFDELNAELEGQTATVPSIVMAWKARLKYSFLEAQIELLRSNLERLKSTLTLMLNVLIFAVQVRRSVESGGLLEPDYVLLTDRGCSKAIEISPPYEIKGPWSRFSSRIKMPQRADISTPGKPSVGKIRQTLHKQRGGNLPMRPRLEQWQSVSSTKRNH